MVENLLLNIIVWNAVVLRQTSGTKKVTVIVLRVRNPVFENVEYKHLLKCLKTLPGQWSDPVVSSMTQICVKMTKKGSYWRRVKH